MISEYPRFSIPRVDGFADLTPLPENKYRQDKVIEDLKKGFLITFANSASSDGYIATVTRIFADLFIVEASSAGLILPNPSESYFRLGLSISRRKQAGDLFPDAVWLMNASSKRPVEQKFRVENPAAASLTEDEFWRRYNISAVDPKATRQFYKLQKERLESAADFPFDSSWISGGK
jgi:hypothetical protein